MTRGLAVIDAVRAYCDGPILLDPATTIGNPQRQSGSSPLRRTACSLSAAGVRKARFVGLKALGHPAKFVGALRDPWLNGDAHPQFGGPRQRNKASCSPAAIRPRTDQD